MLSNPFSKLLKYRSVVSASNVAEETIHLFQDVCFEFSLWRFFHEFHRSLSGRSISLMIIHPWHILLRCLGSFYPQNEHGGLLNNLVHEILWLQHWWPPFFEAGWQLCINYSLWGQPRGGIGGFLFETSSRNWGISFWDFMSFKKLRKWKYELFSLNQFRQ